jgi:cation diffusion facilitator CzcD-associated flavoprotein CzcO
VTESFEIVVIGAGFAGLGMAWQLEANAFTDFVVLERAHDVGGTWRDNSYPGAACDIRSDLYSFSFAPNPDWRHSYGRQPEILDYLRALSHRPGIRERVRLGTEVTAARWDPDAGRWLLETTTGALSARVLISGHGPLLEPAWPDLPGLETFRGPRFHSARWDHDVTLDGKSVAVVGTGASSIQLVPEVQRVAGTLTVFQRTAPWIIPRAERPTSRRRRRLFRSVPTLQRLSRGVAFVSNELRYPGFRYRWIGTIVEAYARSFRRRQLSDPELRARLEPSYRIGCKRVLVSSDYYPALAQSNTRLVTEPIARVEPDAVVTADGERHPIDVLVCGTGFDATHPPIARVITGADGVTLARRWDDGMTALRGTTVPGFPNLFLLIGPNTLLGHNSMIYVIESQVRYVIQALRHLRQLDGGSLDATLEAAAAYQARLDRVLAASVWAPGGCRSFYLEANGRNTVVWPGPASAFRAAVRRFDPAEYR